MLKLKKIKKSYKVAKESIPALNEIDVEFRKNEFVSILGPSGCGKTTLLNIIGGLDRYDEGDILIKGISTKKFKDSDWDAYRNYSVGFIFQTYNLIPHLSVLANVELALTISGMSKKERKKKAIDALKQVGLQDKLNQKPNQLSGGQMQRVAIARAIVNDPEIILADEPTGALDSKTSVQIMEILKEIAKDRLVIMVTHNPELADIYSTRIIKLLDGSIIDDSNEFDSEKKHERLNKKSRNKTSMSFFTSLSLSLKNLFTKKIRTILVSIAGSIGIIGIALVLSLSNGFKKFVNKIQTDTISSYPLMIEESSASITDLISNILNKTDLEKFPGLKEVYINKVTENRENMYIKNNITDEYIENVINTIDKELLIGITYGRDMELNFYIDSEYRTVVSNGVDYYARLSTSSWQEMIDNIPFIDSQYDVLEGKLPTEKDEIAIVVDQYNRLTDSTLISLGLYEKGEERQKYTFDELLNTKYKVLTNDELYNCNESVCYGTNGWINAEMYDSGLTLNVVGIIRAKESTTMGTLNSAIAYSTRLTEYIIERNANSKLVKYLNDNVNIDPFTGIEYSDDPKNNITKEDKYISVSNKYGRIVTPTSINIYPKDYESKVLIKEHLDAYNEDKEDVNKIIYTDYMEIIIKTINTMITTISYVLIAFTAISLIVSSVMIAIITYISVIERTKEIGVLRSIGARKKDISRVFNSETFIIGFVAGIIGIVSTIILNVPINLLVSALVEGVDNISALSLVHAIILMIISIVLTLIAGFIPSKMAAKKDPVVALRSE